ncbi:hypothetical protein MASR2M66_16700 [Chloroflexota bacterium]
MFNGTRVGVGGRVGVEDGVGVWMVTVMVPLGETVSEPEINGSYVGKATGWGVAGAQETINSKSSNAKADLNGDMNVILPK